MKPHVHTEKHIVQSPQFNVTASSLTQVIIAEGVAVVNKDFVSEVEEGSTISAIYCEYWESGGGSGLGFGISTIEKLPGGLPTQTFTQSLNLNSYPNKKNIFYTFEGLIPEISANPIPIIRKWLKIPKGKQRMGLGDKIAINFTSDGSVKVICGFSLYKEQK